ncbi:MAG: cobyric acid synthase [Termitinemataceae bacterium]|nr:MAG: cobyric acid synthase [Termitinemataceae bacterium]
MSAIMLQGTGSDVGKSILVAGLCRVFADRGMKVLPFKAQNMSNNAAPAIDGGEIGRAQHLQAIACRVAPSVHHNPVLLKPQSDIGAQVIVQGKMYGNIAAKDFNFNRRDLLKTVLESFDILKNKSDIVVVEGAGSPAEINLREGDIANMGFACAAKVPVILVGDIDRGGVIASIVGTKNVLNQIDAAMIKGFIINRFRGDVALFNDGYTSIESFTGWHGFGIVPWIDAARSLPQEDAIPKDIDSNGTVTIAIPLLPHISNHDDFDALEAEGSVKIVRVPPNKPIPATAKLVILPGSKSTISDLSFLRKQGWDIDLAAHIRRKGRVLGICGGYQMLGLTIADPCGVEGAPCEVAGLGLLPIHTTLESEKRVRDVQGISIADNMPFCGYEIHCGRTMPEKDVAPMLQFQDGEFDGAVSADGLVSGCYVHRLFDDARQRKCILKKLGGASDGIDQNVRVEAALDAVADVLKNCLDIDGILETAQ